MYIVQSGGVKVNVHVQPGSTRQGFTGRCGNRLKIKLLQRAIDGRANDALIEFMAGQFGLSKSCISILRGQSCRDKTVFLAGNPQVLVKQLQQVL